MPKTNSPQLDRYEAIHSAFHWHVPKLFNIAQACSTRWAADANTAKNVAVHVYSSLTPGQKHTFFELETAAQSLHALLAAQGVRRGDRVAIVLPQRFECAVAYMAVLRMGAVAVPLSQLFGPEALQYRLQDSEASLALVDASTAAAVLAVRAECCALKAVVTVEKGVKNADLKWNCQDVTDSIEFDATKLGRSPPPVNTRADEAAVLIYTSGTTGQAKGALIPHRALIGNLTGFVASQNWFGFDPASGKDAGGQVFWSPADWAWTGGLMDALLPTLYFGKPIVATNSRFSPQMAFDVLTKHAVTHTFLFPTALKAMMKTVPEPRKTYPQLRLQAVMSAGEAVGDAVYGWCERELGVRVNEMFGQTEINYVVGNCNRLWPSKPGSMGKAYPGHRVDLIDEAGQPVPQGQPGEVAVHRLDRHGHPDPVFFLGYWKRHEATAAKYSGDPANSWCRTGDVATQDADGYLWYQGRTDDMFKAAGYRIGPGEVENCLVSHPAVLNAAVVPKPDAERGAIVKAYVVVNPTWLAANAGSEAQSKTVARNVIETMTPGQKDVKSGSNWQIQLTQALQAHVKGRLAPYEYPKEIEFINELPMTTTGKVQRRVLRLREEERATLSNPGVKPKPAGRLM